MDGIRSLQGRSVASHMLEELLRPCKNACVIRMVLRFSVCDFSGIRKN